MYLLISDIVLVQVQSFKLFFFQCASAVDNLAAFYFNNITMGEARNSPAVMNLARQIVD